jgi:hypothetical protein
MRFNSHEGADPAWCGFFEGPQRLWLSVLHFFVFPRALTCASRLCHRSPRLQLGFSGLAGQTQTSRKVLVL